MQTYGIAWRLENSHISLYHSSLYRPRQKGIRVSLAGLKVTFPPCLVSRVFLWIPWSSQLSWKGLTVHPIGCTCNFALAWPLFPCFSLAAGSDFTAVLWNTHQVGPRVKWVCPDILWIFKKKISGVIQWGNAESASSRNHPRAFQGNCNLPIL